MNGGSTGTAVCVINHPANSALILVSMTFNGVDRIGSPLEVIAYAAAVTATAKFADAG